MKGYRTVLVNLGIAVGTAASSALLNFDWVHQVGPTAAMVIVSLINIGLRAVTNTGIGKAGPTA